MRFVIITHVHHIKTNQAYFGYAPYIREINIWTKYVDELVVVAPIIEKKIGAIDLSYQHPNVRFLAVPPFETTSVKHILKTIKQLPVVVLQTYKAMSQADHIHLRCPGNMGLIGAIVQIFFPKTKKTAKYAGNWDSKSKQPWSYRLQKWILSNTFLTRKMQVLVYGEWENQSKNIKSFFTATYSQLEIQNSEVIKQKLGFREGIKFLFVGTLSQGKQPLYAVQLVERLIKMGLKVSLDIYGEGVLRKEIEIYIETHNLSENIILKGNQTKEVVEKAYKTSHFLVLPSKSEGWPKVVAEAMFWGCLPIVSKISCVPYMLAYGKRGVLLEENLESDIFLIEQLLQDEVSYSLMTQNAQNWSREYTLERFETEIKKLLL